MADGVMSEIIIRRQKIPVRTVDVPQEKLRFFPENPRIYAVLNVDGHRPSQDEILKQLLSLEHVRTLILDIQSNGGLIDPLIVRDSSLEVLEGNSRLAAYRELARREPLRWRTVRCTILPADIDEALIFALLGQYHVKGKKAWMPFEQAGFLYRRFKSHNLDHVALGKEIGFSAQQVKHLIETYEFMQDHSEPPDRWSYYDEYLKSSKIRKARAAYPNLDKLIVRKIKAGEIERAVDVRDGLPHICIAPKILKKFAEGKLPFADAHEHAVDAGSDNADYRRLVKFKERIAEPRFEALLLKSTGQMKQKFLYELEKIDARLKLLRTKLKQKSS